MHERFPFDASYNWAAGTNGSNAIVATLSNSLASGNGLGNFNVTNDSSPPSNSLTAIAFTNFSSFPFGTTLISSNGTADDTSNISTGLSYDFTKIKDLWNLTLSNGAWVTNAVSIFYAQLPSYPSSPGVFSDAQSFMTSADSANLGNVIINRHINGAAGYYYTLECTDPTTYYGSTPPNTPTLAATNSYNQITVSPNLWYRIVFQINTNGAVQLAIGTTNGTLVGYVTNQIQSVDIGKYITAIPWGWLSGESTPGSGVVPAMAHWVISLNRPLTTNQFINVAQNGP